MKIIFLDIDGVLVTRGSIIESARKKAFPHLFDPIAVRNLNELVRRSGAHLVLSSVWRRLWKENEFAAHAKGQGVEVEIRGRTPFHPDGERGDEIGSWLSKNPVESFVILDDDRDMGEHLPRLVQTSMSTGLMQQHVEDALFILGVPHVQKPKEAGPLWGQPAAVGEDRIIDWCG